MSNFEDLLTQAIAEIERSKDMKTLELVRIKFLGKKGHVNQKLIKLRDLEPKNRPILGSLINKIKRGIQKAFLEKKNLLDSVIFNTRVIEEKLDISLPGRRMDIGSFHPISQTIFRVENFFSKLGFLVATGLEIEDDYHNFDALNIPRYHPSRADYDTFWFDSTRLLRTQTSGVQIRVMKSQQPPLRIISSGRVYRNDYDQTHTPMFHQVEGLMIDTDINFANLKSMMYNFLQYFFEERFKIRFRPSYFPFTRPSAEIDIRGKNNHWIEVIGCGIVHTNVLNNVNIDSEIFSGFAFGIGVERLTMLYYGVTDLREFYKNDLRFLNQFK